MSEAEDRKPKLVYQCPDCTKVFDTIEQCQEHMRIHNKDKKVAGVYLEYLQGEWQLRDDTRWVSNDYEIDNAIRRGFYNSWYTETEDSISSIVEARERLKETAVRHLRKDAMDIENLDTWKTKK